MSTGGQTCTWDWPPWARICPSPTCREPSAMPSLLGCQALPPAVQVLISLWSQQSSWYTQVIPVTPKKEAVERAQMTSLSQLTDSMSWAFSETRPCWPSTARRECSSVPLKTSEYCCLKMTNIHVCCRELPVQFPRFCSRSEKTKQKPHNKTLLTLCDVEDSICLEKDGELWTTKQCNFLHFTVFSCR